MLVKYLNRAPWGTICSAEAEGGGEAGGGGGKPPEQGTLPGVAPESRPDDAAKIKAELEAKNKELERLRAESDKRTKAEKEAEDKKRLEEEGAKRLLEERNAELEAANARLKQFEKENKDRADAIFAKLPEATQKKLDLVRGEMSTAGFLKLLEAESGDIGVNVEKPETPLPPPTSTHRPPGSKPTDKHEPTPEASKLLDGMMRDTKTLRELTVSTTEKGTPKFTMSVREMFDKMKHRPATVISEDNLRKRER